MNTGGDSNEAVATAKRPPRGGARETERDVFAARTIGQSAPQRAAGHHAGAAAYPRCSMCLVAFLGACALSLCEGTKSGPQCAFPFYVPLPRGQRYRFYVRACAHRPQQPQRHTYYNVTSSIFASVDPSPGACLQPRENHILARQDIFCLNFTQLQYYNGTVLLSNTKVLKFRTEWCDLRA